MPRITLLVVVLLVGCQTPRAGDRVPAAPPRPGDAAPPAPPTTGAPPPAADPAVLAKLRSTTPCVVSAQGIGQMCQAEAELKEFVKTYAGAQLVDSCLAALADGDPTTRYLAASCLELAEVKSPERERVLKVVLARIEHEADWKLKTALARAVRRASAEQAGVADEVRSKVRAWARRPESSFGAAALFGTLHTGALFGTEAPPATTVDLALELVDSDDYYLRESVFGTLEAAKSRSAEACTALAGVVRAKREGWGQALGALLSIGAPCQASVAAGVQATLEKLEAAADARSTPKDRFNVNDWRGPYRLCRSQDLAQGTKALIARAAAKYAASKNADLSDQRNAKALAAACRQPAAPKK